MPLEIVRGHLLGTPVTRLLDFERTADSHLLTAFRLRCLNDCVANPLAWISPVVSAAAIR
jgi:hypothetical protein